MKKTLHLKTAAGFLLMLLLLGAFGSFSVTSAAAVKNGLKKENGKYYFYVKGKKVKNTWKTITKAGKKNKYYFGKNGAAYQAETGMKNYNTGKPYYSFKIYKISKKIYAFDADAHMVTGFVSTVDGKVYYFSDKGVYNETKTKKARKILKRGLKTGNALSQIKKILGKPKKTKVTPDVICEVVYPEWTDLYEQSLVTMNYGRFMVSLIKNDRTGEYFMDYVKAY